MPTFKVGAEDQPERLPSVMRRLAIYPGSFDPPTLGHLDVIERAARLFDEIIVAVGVNQAKTPFLSLEERMRALAVATEGVPNVTIDHFEGLLVHYAEAKGAKALVRGLRATSDFDFEFQIAMANRRLNDSIESVFLMTKWEHSFLTSSVVREVAQLGGDFSGFVHPGVAEIVRAHLNRE